MSAGKAIILITGAGLLLRIWGLAAQPLTADDTLFLDVTVGYARGGFLGVTYWYHPQLRNLLLYLSAETLGYGPLGVRAASVMAGTLAVPLTYLFLREAGAGGRAALAAAFLMAFEQVSITYSRQLIGEPVTGVFILAGAYFFLRYRARGAPMPLVLSGLAFGLGAASKFHALPPLALCLALCLWGAWRARSGERAALAVASYALLALAVYLAAYYPWFARGYGLADWVRMQQEIILKMVSHEGNPNELISELHFRAWRWFLLPTGYVEFFTYRTEPHVTLAFTNVLVWGTVLPGVAYTAWRAWGPGLEGGREGMRFLVMMFLVSYLPLVTASRPVFLLSSLSALPFAFGCVGVMADGLLRGRPRWAWGALGAVVVGGCLLLYPMAVGKALDYGYTKSIAYKYGPHR